MSVSQNISEWKKRSKIDYFPLFISLWLALNAWMKDRCPGQSDRDRLNSLKLGGYSVSDRFAELLFAGDSNGELFRANLSELHRALDNARIPYDYRRWPNKTISLTNCFTDWNNGNPTFSSVVKRKRQHNKIQLDDEIYVENDVNNLFAFYVEIVYQIRCVLFHGDLEPNRDNERVITQLHITLSMIMERI